MNPTTLRRALVWVSGGALLVAMGVDTLAMLGRQLAIPFIGSIEIVQTAALMAALGGILIASLDRAHARVNLLLDRLPQGWGAVIGTIHERVSAVFWAALLAGSAWIAADLWNGHEESELLRIPYRPLRLAVVCTLGTLLVLSLRRSRRRETP